MTHHNVIPLDRARMARAVRDRPLIDLFAALSAGDAARRELARHREQQPSPGEVLWALIGASVAMWAIILKLVGVL